jgi:hypothetical protein
MNPSEREQVREALEQARHSIDTRYGEPGSNNIDRDLLTNVAAALALLDGEAEPQPAEPEPCWMCGGDRVLPVADPGRMEVTGEVPCPTCCPQGEGGPR